MIAESDDPDQVHVDVADTFDEDALVQALETKLHVIVHRTPQGSENTFKADGVLSGVLSLGDGSVFAASSTAAGMNPCDGPLKIFLFTG